MNERASRRGNMDGSMVWKINCATKHGVDTILVRGDSKPTKTQLNKLYTKLRKEFGISKDDESCYVELAGCIDIRDIPFTEDYLKRESL